MLLHLYMMCSLFGTARIFCNVLQGGMAKASEYPALYNVSVNAESDLDGLDT